MLNLCALRACLIADRDYAAPMPVNDIYRCFILEAFHDDRRIEHRSPRIAMNGCASTHNFRNLQLILDLPHCDWCMQANARDKVSIFPKTAGIDGLLT